MRPDQTSNSDSQSFSTTDVARPWGSFRVLSRGEGFLIKRLVIAPNARLSLQYHRWRSEHWIVLHGTARATVEDREVTLTGDESVFVAARAIHRLANPTSELLHLIEVQTGWRLLDDDIVRLDDDYGRVSE